MFEALFGLLCFLIGSAVVLAIVAVVGHGLWKMFAAIFGSSAPSEERDRLARNPYRTCVGCDQEFARSREVCPSCGLDPASVHADELKDLKATRRTLQKMREQGTLATDVLAQLEQSLQARHEALLPRRQRRREAAPLAVATPVAQLDALFGEDEPELGLAERKEALALARTLQPSDLRELSPRALAGIAHLQTSVGMLSRACRTYQSLFDQHADAVEARTARAALQAADQLDDHALVADFIRSVSAMPGLVESDAGLAQLIERLRGEAVLEAPAASPAPAAPVVLELAPADMVEAAPVPAVACISPQAPIQTGEESLTPPPPIPLPGGEGRIAARRRFAEWIAVFMEEKNILWGELIGGTLIVGCSIALVISLWSKLEQIEYFPFLIIAAVTSALFGAGLYTLHHWKLESTSRGLLLIATLLVPLDFLVLAGLTHVDQAGIRDYLTALGGLAVFGWFLHRSSRILITAPLDIDVPSSLLVAAAMLVSAAAQLLFPTWLSHTAEPATCHFVLSLLAALAQVGALGWILLRMAALESWSVGRAVALLIALGSVTFACCVTLSYPLYRADELAEALRHFGPAVTLLGVPILLAGTLIHQKLAPSSSEARADVGEPSGLWRTLGTALALAGVFVMFGGFAAAIDDPVLRLVCGILNVVTLVAVASFQRVPALHVAVQVYLAILVVYGWRLDLETLRDYPHAGLRLTGLLVAQVVIGELLVRWHRRLDATYYAVGGAVSTALAAILVLPFAFTHPQVVAFVLGTAALTWFGGNLRWRRAEITYGCALVLAGAIYFAFRHFYRDGSYPEVLLWSLLTHASVCLAAGIALRPARLDWLHERFRLPLEFAGLIGSLAGVLVLLGGQFPPIEWALGWRESALACCWLAALWGTLAVLEGWPILFGAFQVVLGLAWIFGIGGWLTEHGWDWREPYSLHLYALGLGVLSLTWELARMACRERARLAVLLAPPFVPIDRIVTGGLILGQYALTVAVVLWGCGRELSFTPDDWRILPTAWHDNAYSPWAWLVPMVLAAVLALWLREFDLALPSLGLTLLLLTIPLLVAGTWFDSALAAASAARWGLALVYGLVSLALWYRHRLGDERSEHVPVLGIRGLLLVGALVPVLILTLHVVGPVLAGEHLPGPLDASIFMRMGGAASLLVPLSLLSAALAGHGFRERLAYYLLAAGFLADASGVGGYFLALQQRHIDLDQTWVAVNALLLAAGIAWVWTMVWCWTAGVLERGERRPLLDSLLLSLHGVLGICLFGLVLTSALDWVMFRTDDAGRPWTLAAGSPWSWLVWGLMSAGLGSLYWTRRAYLPLHLLGALGLAALGVLACSVEILAPRESYLALMFGAGVFACVWVWLTLFLDPEQPPRWLNFTNELWESPIYASIAICVATMLGCVPFVNDRHDPIWCAQSIALAAFACGLLAYQRKTEVWGSFASLLMMLASTVLVLHLGKDEPHLFLLTVHINLAVLGALALVRLGLHHFLAPPEVGLAQVWQVPVQICIGLSGNLLLTLSALMPIIGFPDDPGRWLRMHCEWAAWLALATNAAAALWYTGIVRPGIVVNVVAFVGLLAGVLLAGSADTLWRDVPWLAHHVLTVAWTALAAGMLAASWVGHSPLPAGGEGSGVRGWLASWFPAPVTRAWVSICGAFVVLLALRAASVAPALPEWPVANTLAVSVLFGAVALWSRAPGYLFASGLLFNVIGWLIYSAWAVHHPNRTDLERLLYILLTQALSFGSAAIAWSLLEWALARKRIEISHGIALFTQAVIFAGVGLLATAVVLTNAWYLGGTLVRVEQAFLWTGVGVLSGAALIELWRPRRHRFARVQLHITGLCAIGVLLYGLDLRGADWTWAATLLLAGYVFVIVAVMRLAHLSPVLEDLLDLPTQPDAGGVWFWYLQLGTAGLVLALSMWITLSFTTWQERLAGAVASALVTAAAFLLTQAWPRFFPPDGEATEFGLQHRLFPSSLVLSLGVVIALEAGWAFIDLTMPALWLQRTGAALALTALAAVVYRFALPYGWPGSIWTEASRPISALLGGICVIIAVMLIGQELVMFDPLVRRTPLHLVLIIAAAAALVGLAVHSLRSALAREPDAYGIEGDYRAFYVYLAELLAVMVFMHVRLHYVGAFTRAIGQYWYFVLLVIAFVWLTLSEIFKRKNLPVLATPMLRTAILLAFVPVLFFRLVLPIAHRIEPWQEELKGLQPFMTYLKEMGDPFLREAMCWLLVGIFFGWLAQLRRSANMGIFAALAINAGLWVLLGHQDATTFLQRPQLWLIPLGVIVLVAEYINRDRLGFWPSLSVRYGGLLCIYLSSTFEMFQHWLQAGGWYLPIVLALLAVGGMMLGILFRVRAFLLSGFMALLVVIFAQIWNAAVNHSQTWVWWACGIILGVIILVLFAVFEKHKNGVLKVIDNMKGWS